MGGVIRVKLSQSKYQAGADPIPEDVDVSPQEDDTRNEENVKEISDEEALWDEKIFVITQKYSSKELQEMAIKFVSDHLYYAVPVRSNTRTSDKKPVIWIEPLPHLIEGALSGKPGLDKGLVESLPTGVLIDSEGSVKIYFSSMGYEYKISSLFMELLCQRTPFPLVAPQWPKLKSSSTSSLTLCWYKELPLPVGIIQTVEIQFTTLDHEEDERYRWQVLVTKHYHTSLFCEFTHASLQPGRPFRFRLRYLSVKGWSDFSPPSPVYFTLPTVPDPPAAPVCVSITCYALELSWFPPLNNNGSAVGEYVLMGKSVGDEFSVLYHGPNTSYLALGLYPEFAYSFKVAGGNAQGLSPFSPLVSVQTPPAPPRRIVERKAIDRNAPAATRYFSEREIERARDCSDAWGEFWDPRTEQAFYFNSIIAVRQLEMPDVWKDRKEGSEKGVKEEKNGEGEVEGGKGGLGEESKAFRVKRYRLLRALHRRKAQLVKSLLAEDMEGEERREFSPLLNPPSTSPLSPVRKNTTLLTLRRESLLEDAYRAITLFNQLEVMLKFQFCFEREEGIDSGGVGKEAFLLISQACAKYLFRRKIMLYTAPTGQGEREEEKREEAGGSSKVSAAENFSHGLFFSPTSSFSAPSLPLSSNSPSPPPPNSLSSVSPELLSSFLGRLLGKAVLDRQLVAFPLSRPLLRHMIGGDLLSLRVEQLDTQKSRDLAPALLERVREIDGEYCQSMLYLLQHSIEDLLGDEQTFTIQEGEKTLPLCPNGSELLVNEENKAYYVCLLSLWKIQYSISSTLSPFLEAFHAIVPLSILKEAQLSPVELGKILVGKEKVNVEELRAYCLYQDETFSEFHESAVWFWRAVREFDDEQKRELLQFFTGSGRVPLDGYDPHLTLTLGMDMPEDSLPRAHTCFNQLVLPTYSSYDKCKEKILFAVQNCRSFNLS